MKSDTHEHAIFIASIPKVLCLTFGQSLLKLSSYTITWPSDAHTTALLTTAKAHRTKNPRRSQ
jgi:hypothetical protein